MTIFQVKVVKIFFKQQINRQTDKDTNFKKEIENLIRFNSKNMTNSVKWKTLKIQLQLVDLLSFVRIP